MRSINSVHIVYFSGTGCTERVAKNMADCFISQGIALSISELKKAAHVKIDSDFLIVLYPVYDFGAPKPIIEWIAQTPSANNIPAAVISVSGGGDISPNTACRVDVINKISKKGYDVCYESMIVMPSNVIIRFDDVVSAMLLRKMPIATEKIVSDILSGNRIRKKPLLIDRFFEGLGSIGRNYGKSFAKHLHVSNDCIGCSWCKNHCPRENIRMYDGKPSFGKDCTICLRCVYGCPKKAITVSGTCKMLVLKEGYDLNTIEQYERELSEVPPISQIAKGYLYKGVKKYLNDNK